MAGDTISKGLNFKVFTGRLPRIPPLVSETFSTTYPPASFKASYSKFQWEPRLESFLIALRLILVLPVVKPTVNFPQQNSRTLSWHIRCLRNKLFDLETRRLRKTRGDKIDHTHLRQVVMLSNALKSTVCLLKSTVCLCMSVWVRQLKNYQMY